MSTDGDTKTRPIHEIVIELLSDVYDPANAAAWARLYMAGATVPQDSIEPLAEAFRSAVHHYGDLTHETVSVRIIDTAIAAIEGQKEKETASEAGK